MKSAAADGITRSTNFATPSIASADILAKELIGLPDGNFHVYNSNMKIYLSRTVLSTECPDNTERLGNCEHEVEEGVALALIRAGLAKPADKPKRKRPAF